MTREKNTNTIKILIKTLTFFIIKKKTYEPWDLEFRAVQWKIYGLSPSKEKKYYPN